MEQKQAYEPLLIQANMDMLSDIYELIHMTIKAIYTK